MHKLKKIKNKIKIKNYPSELNWKFEKKKKLFITPLLKIIANLCILSG